jgi:GcrA cell cycle regulator
MLTQKHGTLWSSEEEHILRSLVPTTGIADLADILGRTIGSVRCKARAIKLRFPIRYVHVKFWQPHEDDLLRQLSKEGCTSKIAAKRVGRTQWATQTRALRLKIKFATTKRRTAWREDELDTAKQMWKFCTGEQIAQKLGRGLTREAVIGMMRRHRMPAKQRHKPNPSTAVRRKMQSIGTPRPPLRPLPQKSTKEFILGPLRSRNPKRPIELPVYVDVARVKHADLEYGHCRWPVGDPQTSHSRAFFCGAKRVTGLPYCEQHKRRAYRQ